MNLTRFALRNRAIVLAVVAVLMPYGLITFLTMPRREDPEITIRVCMVVTRWPGAMAEKVEELVTDPLEKVIDQIDVVHRVTSTTRTGLSIIQVELEETVPGAAVDQHWDEVRAKVEEVAPGLPEGCGVPRVDADFDDVFAVIYALFQRPPSAPGRPTREYTYRELELLAERVRDDFKTVGAVAKVEIEGAQEEVIYVDVDAEWAKVGLSIDQLRSLLGERNIVAAGGEIDRGDTKFTVQPTGEFTSEAQIANVLVGKQDGVLPVRLTDLPFSGPRAPPDEPLPGVTIRRGYLDPPATLFRYAEPGTRADRCLLIAVAMKSGRNVVEMGDALAGRVAALQATILPPDVELVRVNDLPAQVEGLVSGFVDNLWQAVLIVLLIALVVIGWWPAVIMATAVPLCMISAVLVVSAMGVELEQFSIASLIIALGLLVDNAIVVSDNVLRELRGPGESDVAARERAAVAGASSLAVPILTSTATTVAAFLPMITIIGNVGEYTRSLPIVVATTLAISYLVAMTVTPILCFWLLRPGRAAGGLRRSVAARLARLSGLLRAGRGRGYEAAVRWCLRHRALTLGLAAAAVLGSLSLIPSIGSQFFPAGVRDQFFIHVWVPEGATIAATARKCRAVEDILLETSATTVDGRRVERLRNVTTFVGTGGPRINLTTDPRQSFPNYAFLLVNTTDADTSRPWAAEVERLTDRIPGARVEVVPFVLGPYIENPVEFRLLGEDAVVLRAAAERMVGAFRETPGTVDPFSNWYNFGYGVEVDIDEEAANLAGVSNRAVADTMATLISGGHLTTYREGDHQVPVMLRMKPALRAALLDDPGAIYVDGVAGKIPLESLATVTATWRPAVIARRDNVRCVTVGSKVSPGRLANDVAAAIRPRLDAVLAELPPGYRLEEGGEPEQTTEAQDKLIGAFAISFVLILLVLVAQYDSFAKPLVVLATIPLASVGALLALYATGWALGFMPSLGVIALAGVVINNAIILIDVVEVNVRRGASLEDAIASAGAQRMQPILLTTMTTVGGLLPLASWGGPMWAGMAWAMIGGLVLSTGLTLLVVPTIYATFVRALRMRVVRRPG